MLTCDGFKMFRGTATVTPITDMPPFDMTGTWLYRPDTRCWYCEPDDGFAASYPERLITIKEA